MVPSQRVDTVSVTPNNIRNDAGACAKEKLENRNRTKTGERRSVSFTRTPSFRVRTAQNQIHRLEARGGIEPPIGALQAPALPLGHRAQKMRFKNLRLENQILPRPTFASLSTNLRKKTGSAEQKNSAH